ncbi:hypothetical protein AgCh_005544 [Apium graveolens]
MMGGARYMFLTHRDDIEDHMKWSKRLGCDRIIHSEEVDASTAEVECKLEGNGPWKLADDLELIHTLGHTKGSPKQPGGYECGYVVMRYMKEIFEDKEMKFITKWVAKTRKCYTREELDEVRFETLQYVQEFV